MFFDTLKAPLTKVYLFQPIATPPFHPLSIFPLTNPPLRASLMPNRVHKTNPSKPHCMTFPSSTLDPCLDTFNGSMAPSIGPLKGKLLPPEAQLKQKYMQQMNAPKYTTHSPHPRGSSPSLNFLSSIQTHIQRQQRLHTLVIQHDNKGTPTCPNYRKCGPRIHPKQRNLRTPH